MASVYYHVSKLTSSQLLPLHHGESDLSVKVGSATYLLHGLSEHQFPSLLKGADTHSFDGVTVRSKQTVSLQ